MTKNQYLEIYIDTVHQKYRKVFTDYEELATRINENFNFDCTASEILSYYEEEDMKLIYKHCVE